jgi:hypothetical protein
MGYRHRVRFAMGLLLLGALGALFAACSATSADGTVPRKCTPGNFVFCRCADGADGTKLCHEDGLTFDECVCGGDAAPADLDAGLPSTPLEPVEAGPVTGPTLDARCAGKLGLVAGSATGTDTLVATYAGAGVFNTAKSASSPGVRGPVTILPSGASLVATYTARYGYVAWTKLAGTSWSAPATLGDGTADTAAATSMTALGADLRLFYRGQDGRFHTGKYTASGWDITLTAGALAEPAGDAGAAIPGKSSPAAATLGSTLTLAFTGSDGSLARTTSAGTTWSSFTKFTAALAHGTAPALTALEPGGTRDAVLVYPTKDNLLRVAVRDAANGAWSSAILFDATTSATELSLAPLPGQKALLAYKAANGQGYYAVWSAATGFGAPSELVAGANPTLASAPSIARGQCGSDATIAYAQADGLVKLMRLTGSAMSGPFDVGGITGVMFVGVGELP